MIKRSILPEVTNHLKEKEITLIVGPRQAGKTTLIEMLGEDLRRKGEKTLFLNLDIEADNRFFSSQAQLVEKIAVEIGKDRGYVFIDEIQRKQDAGLFLKGIFDMKLPYKFVVSGSGSLELKESIHESLAGRKGVFELSTLTFSEFLNYKTEYRYEQNLEQFIRLEPERMQFLLEEYLTYGGYPRVVLSDTLFGKRLVMNDLYQSYLERDIKSLLNVQKSESFTNLVRLMASQIGSLVNVFELANTLNLATDTVNNYLWYMQKTFLLDKVQPFFRNTRKEITKSPVMYFHDLGMRNYALGIFGLLPQGGESGFLFQHLVYRLLREQVRYTSSQIHYWRSISKAEVDFVIDTGMGLIPLEAKYTKLTRPTVTRSFASFIEKYQPAKGYIVHLGEESQKQIGTTMVHFIPFHRLLSPLL